MKFRSLTPLALVPLLLLGGCDELRQNKTVRSAARDVLVAQAYEDIERADRNGDGATTGKAIQRFMELSPGRGTLQQYADSLNMEGYLLADKGKSIEDFQRAEYLTRLAVELCDDAISRKPSRDLRAQRSMTRDSLAWALFRLNKLDEAERQQREAIREARETDTLSAELPLHMGDILLKAGKTEAARAAYKETLTLRESEPDAHKRARAALKKLPAGADSNKLEPNEPGA